MQDSVIKTFWEVCDRYPSEIALMSKDKAGKWQEISYRDFRGLVERFGAGLLDFGVKRGDHVGIITDNRKEWIIANFAILGIGAADVPRGSDTMPDEARYILAHAECAVTLAENEEQLRKILSQKKGLPLLKAIIVIDEGFSPASFTEPTQGVSLLTFSDIMDRGKRTLEKDPQAYQRELARGKPEDLATLIYTSGTTGEPKGVMLSHANFLHQLRVIEPQAIQVGPEDIFLSVLPVWHSFERIVECLVISRGATLAYSKRVGSVMLADMVSVRPTVMASAPRIWEAVRAGIIRKMNEEGGIKKAMFNFFVAVGRTYVPLSAMVKGLYPRFTRRVRLFDFLLAIVPFLLLLPLQGLGSVLVFSKIKAKLGGRFRFTVSGGGALPPHVDRFFAAAGILLLEGYGLTETTPVVSVRLQKHPVIGTIGPVLEEMEVKLLDPDTGKQVGPGRKGVIYLKGPNVMKGYYNRPDKTAEVLSADGWLNTGDLGMQTWDGELKIIGRTKETIVLLGGENIEPVPIEDTIMESDYIDQVMVVGQDQKFLGALVVPSTEAIEAWARHAGIASVSSEDLLQNPQVHQLVSDEINSRVNAKRGFREWERIFRFALIRRHFEEPVELSGTLKMKRNVIAEIYRKEIAEMFAK
jgi:long-chain acyl-CoA synthetase